MPILLAYCAVVLIWSTTPIAIQFSQLDFSYYSALCLRMWGSAVLSMPLLMLMRQSLDFSTSALKSYFAGAIGVYGAMLCVYWGAAFVPSGLISVLYGLAPMLSGLLGYIWLKERELTPVRIFALLIALTGLYFVVLGQLAIGGQAWRGILGTLLSVACFAISAISVKQVNAGLHPLVQTSGTLWISSIGFLITLPLFEFSTPEYSLSVSWIALGYLASCGSLLGFVLYFYILKHLPTARVALITLIAPVLAMIWGNLLRGELLSTPAILGSSGLLCALALYQWHQKLDRWIQYQWLVQNRAFQKRLVQKRSAVKIKKS